MKARQPAVDDVDGCLPGPGHEDTASRLCIIVSPEIKSADLRFASKPSSTGSKTDTTQRSFSITPVVLTHSPSFHGPDGMVHPSLPSSTTGVDIFPAPARWICWRASRNPGTNPAAYHEAYFNVHSPSPTYGKTYLNAEAAHSSISSICLPVKARDWLRTGGLVLHTRVRENSPLPFPKKPVKRPPPLDLSRSVKEHSLLEASIARRTSTVRWHGGLVAATRNREESVCYRLSKHNPFK